MPKIAYGGGDFDDKEEATDDIIFHLDERLYEEGWMGNPVTVSGKLRIYNQAVYVEDEKNEPSAQYSDERGKHFNAAGGRFVCDGFGIARDEDGILDESSAIGLTLIPLDEYSEGDGYYEDIKFILYPDDTLFAQFDNPSAAMIELDFKQGPADLYQMLHEAVNASASDAARTRYLRRLRIQDGEYPELGKDYPLKRNISKYIYGKLRIDEDARYRVEVNGVVHTADPSGNPADIVSSNIRTSLTGYIVAIDMSPEADDPDTLRPRLFMAVQAPESEGDWYGIIVPVDSIATPIRNMRSKRSPFGKRAVLAFDSFESVEEFFYDVAGAGGKSDEDGEKDREQTVFEGILKGLDYVWHDTVAYNTEKNCFEVSLHGDVAEILQDFAEFVGKTTGLDVAPTSTDYKSVLDQMHEKTKPKLRMKQGDVIRITGGVKLQMNDGSIVLLPEDGSLSLTGTFDDFSVNTIEDEIIPGATYGSISVMCDDCVIQGEVYKEYHPALQIILQDDSENVFKFVKIEKALPTGEE